MQPGTGAAETPLRRSSRRRGAAPEPGDQQQQPPLEEVPKKDQNESAAGEPGVVPAAEGPVTVAQAQEDGTVAQEEEEKKKAAAEVTHSQELPRQTPGHEKVPSAAKRKLEAPIRKDVPQGKPKSGRVWKDLNKKRFSSMVKDRPLRTSWEVKMKERQEKKMVKSLAQQLKDDKQREKEEKNKRREENLRRRLENERKAEVVQVIRNPAKLKRARKKQLRNIEKRDTLKMSQAGKRLSQKKPAPAKASKEGETVPGKKLTQKKAAPVKAIEESETVPR
ncbi:coiled-coil domain-containing protein 86 [Pseudophryne corroboree]|uniref:coiled-coil domain-containing protein 86 n=1 Tax=Pseudophryne corroboree TaxID=495146 RepID=UPI00308186CF